MQMEMERDSGDGGTRADGVDDRTGPEIHPHQESTASTETGTGTGTGTGTATLVQSPLRIPASEPEPERRSIPTPVVPSSSHTTDNPRDTTDDITTLPPAYSPTSPLQPSPHVPPSPIRARITLPATRPPSFPLLTATPTAPATFPSPTSPNPCFPRRSYPASLTLTPAPIPHQSRLSQAQSVILDIDTHPDNASTHNEVEPLPAYSRYPKHGEASCGGEPDRGSIADTTSGESALGVWPGGDTRRGKKCCGFYMRTLVTGVVVMILACVIAGGVVGWQMKTKYVLLSFAFFMGGGWRRTSEGMSLGVIFFDGL